MKNKAVTVVLAAISVAVTGVALAQAGNGELPNVVIDQHRGPPQHQMHGPMDARRGRGAGPDHNFYKGGRLSPEYRNRQYVVDDWRGHHLSAPPRGYHWVQTGGDYVLVAVATGIIAQILLGH